MLKSKGKVRVEGLDVSTEHESSSSNTSAESGILGDNEDRDMRRTGSYFQESFPSPRATSRGEDRHSPPREPTPMLPTSSLTSIEATGVAEKKQVNNGHRTIANRRDWNILKEHLIREVKPVIESPQEPTSDVLAYGEKAEDPALQVSTDSSAKETEKKSTSSTSLIGSYRRPSLLSSILKTPKRESSSSAGRKRDSTEESISIPSLRSISGGDRQKLREKVMTITQNSLAEYQDSHSSDKEQASIPLRISNPNDTSADRESSNLGHIYQQYGNKGDRQLFDLENHPFSNSSPKSNTPVDPEKASPVFVAIKYSKWHILCMFLIGLIIPPVLFMVGGGAFSGVPDTTLERIALTREYREWQTAGGGERANLRWLRLTAVILGVAELILLIIGIAISLALRSLKGGSSYDYFSFAF